MDRYTWYEEYGFTKPYPGDKKIFTPSQVPGGAILGSDSDG